jgi:hypothetical protein
MEFDDDIPHLATDGRNWSTWREKVEIVIEKAGLHSYLDGTVSEPDRQLEAMAKFILTIGLPDLIFGSMLHLTTTQDCYKYLTNRFDKPTVQPLQERLQKLEGCRDAEPQVAARTRKTFDRPCQKCGERGHKARECRIVGIESGSAKVENNPPEGLPSTSLEGGRTGASDELSEVPNDEMTTSQSTWMLRDESPSGEVHGVARSHEEAAGVDVEGGEAGERTRTSDNEESRAHERIDDRETETASQPVDDEAADTPDPHTKCAEPTRPVGMPHEPADELFGEREGASGEPESVSPPIEGQSGRIPTDRADERKLLGDDLNGMAKFRGAKDRVEGSTTRHSVLIEERGSATARIRSTTTADENDQHDEAIVDDLPEDSSVSPEPPEPPDDPAKRRTQSPSVELEGERMTAASCDVEPAEGEPDASGVPEHVEDDCERQMKLRNKSECVGERWKPRCQKNSPGRPQVELDDPDDEADVLAASGRVEDDWKQPKNLRNASEHERKRSKRRSREDSPDKARGDPDRPDGETAVPGDFQRYRERPRNVRNQPADETDAPHRDNPPGGHRGEWEMLGVVEGNPDRGNVVDLAEHDGICPSSDENERRVETNASCRGNHPGGQIGVERRRGRLEPRKRWRWRQIPWRMRGDGRRNKRRTRRLETSRPETAS